MVFKLLKNKTFFQWGLFVGLLLLGGLPKTIAQVLLDIPVQLQWESDPRIFTGASINTNPNAILPFQKYPHFDGATYSMERPLLPIFNTQAAINSRYELEAVLLNASYEDISFDYAPNYAPSEIEVLVNTAYLKGQPIAKIEFIPIIKNANTGRFQRLVSGRIQVRASNQLLSSAVMRRASTAASTSVLSTGNIYKIAIAESGIYKLDYNFLSQQLGIDVANINPRQIQIFGNGGKLLPELAGTGPDDLIENAIWVEGELDGRFDNGDYILFYGQGTKYWHYDAANLNMPFKHIQNIYTDTTYYFLKINENIGKRISNINNTNNATYNSFVYDALLHHEVDQYNLFDLEQPTLPPTGRLFVGNPFKTNRNQTFAFTFRNIQTATPVKLESNVLARNLGNSTTFRFLYNNNQIATTSVFRVTAGTYDVYANNNIVNTTFNANNGNINIGINMDNAQSSTEGWLDYLTLHARCSLVYAQTPFTFRDAASAGEAISRFNIKNFNANVKVWNISDIYEVQNMQGNLLGNEFQFNANTQDATTVQEFIVFEANAAKTPIAKGMVNNQNLHGLATAPKLLIIYYKDFEQAAQRLMDHRMTVTNMPTVKVDVAQIFNEFGSGNPDISAVRNFIKMLYDRSDANNKLEYVLLLGAGSFDYKGIIYKGEANHNFIPVYETAESQDPIRAYTTDDYFGLLDDNEGNVVANQLMDVAVGRIPAINVKQANDAIDKIIRYETDPQALGDWRNVLSFVSDDEDGNIHFNDIELVGDTLLQRYPVYNVAKIHMDAYAQQSTGGGNRYPEVTESIIRRLTQGALIMNYVGHGADDGWAQERVFTNAEINALSNKYRLPLFITATCSFAPHDDPTITSAAELLLFNPDGGAIALFSTLRVVYANQNSTLLHKTFSYLFNPINGRMPTIGEIIMAAKNDVITRTGSTNTRKFILLGDPSLTLAYPQYKVQTNKINGALPDANTVSISALQPVNIEGEVLLPDGSLASNFNGIVYPIVYDKVDTLYTKGNDNGSNVAPFPLQSKIIFKGRAEVRNGKFDFSFIVPKDINYSIGLGRISYYATENNTLLDAHGYENNFKIGGTYANAATDNIGPEVKVYMNDENFAFGGLTDANPTLLVKLYDENGINTVGNSIGHDLQGKLTLPTITQRTTTSTGEIKTYKLNEAYQAEIGSYKRGIVQYPLRNLSDGLHNIEIEAWDVYNNVGYGSTEFVVSTDAKSALQHVLNYPNPFTTSTNFLFEHNLPGQEMTVQVQIFTISGKLVKTITETRYPESYYIRDIFWDGLDEYGDRLARGTYIYKVMVQTTSSNITKTSDYQKMVILK